jgi:hypothetical protein
MNLDRPIVTSFEDPELKSAVRRAWGSEHAPADLRNRVLNALAADSVRDPNAAAVAESNTLPDTRTRAFWRRPAFGWAAAAAAVVLVGMGLAVSGRLGSTSAPVVASAPVVPSIPTRLAAAMVRTHDSCLRLHADDHHLFHAAPKDDFGKIARAMSARLDHPVIAATVGDGWDFRGAAICPVVGLKSGHLVFARDDAAISVFSLPASAALANCPDHQNCEAAVNGHPMAGFVENGGFYCVVATPGGKLVVDAQHVKTLRDQLHGQVLAASEGRRAHGTLIASMTH